MLPSCSFVLLLNNCLTKKYSEKENGNLRKINCLDHKRTLLLSQTLNFLSCKDIYIYYIVIRKLEIENLLRITMDANKPEGEMHSVFSNCILYSIAFWSTIFKSI